VNIDDINLEFRRIIRALLALGVDAVRPANQNAPTGDDPFVTVWFGNIKDNGYDMAAQTQVQQDQFTEKMLSQCEVVVSVQFYRGDAMQKASALIAKLQTTKGIELMRAASLAFVDKSVIRDLSSVVNTLWEARASVDITLGFVASTEDLVPIVASASINLLALDAQIAPNGTPQIGTQSYDDWFHVSQ
jgi:hypothetical protein